MIKLKSSYKLNEYTTYYESFFVFNQQLSYYSYLELCEWSDVPVDMCIQTIPRSAFGSGQSDHSLFGSVWTAKDPGFLGA